MDHHRAVHPWVIATSLAVLCGTLVQVFLPGSAQCVSTENQRSCRQESLLAGSPMVALGLFIGGMILSALLFKWGQSRWVLLTYGSLTLFFIILSFGVGWPFGIAALLALIAAGS